MASLGFLLRSPSSILSPPVPIPTLYFVINSHHVPSPKPLSTKKTLSFKPLTISHALAESDSPNSKQLDPQSLLQELAVSEAQFLSLSTLSFQIYLYINYFAL